MLCLIGLLKAYAADAVPSYSICAFDQLAFSVEEISKHFFQERPGGTASCRRECQPFGVPDIMGDTQAARGLRCLVVQNQIWDILNRRIFQPFLFTSDYALCSDFGKELKLSMVSAMIREKSVHREAIWRTITLRALYASAYGRKAASVAATGVSREIVEKIHAMTATENQPGLLQAVRLVAKATVQLWRRARLEWDMIHSSMPLASDTEGSYGPTDVMLWIRPHIVRENLLSNVNGDGEQSDQQEIKTVSCYVYLQGTALRPDSPLVLTRRQEVLAGVGG